MKEEMLTQIENDLLTIIRKEIQKKVSGADMVSGLYSMNVVAESIAAYKEKMLEKKEALGLSAEEINDLIEEASMNVLPKILEF